MRDQTAALMVRAAATGAINYATADPYNKQWRIKHVLIVQEIARSCDERLMQSTHNHWLAYVANGNLERDSWDKLKKQAANTLNKLQMTIFPWLVTEETANKNDTIESKYGDLIAQYRAMVAKNAGTDAKNAGS